MADFIYRVHGLVVRSELELPSLHHAAAAVTDADVVVAWGRPRALPGTDVASSIEDGLTTTICRIEDGYRLDFSGRHFVEVASDGSSAVVASDGPEHELVAIVEGGVLAFVQLVRGALALHAASVEIDGRAVVLMGPKRSGKSTIAAIACSRGARLLSDDVTVIDAGSGLPTVYRGSGRLRLRHDSAIVASLFTDGAPLTEALARTVVEPATGIDSVVLSRLVQIVPSEALTPELEQCRPVDGLGYVMRNLRTRGLSDPQLLASQFELAGALIDAGRVDVLKVPGTVDPDDVVAVLLG